MVLTNTFFLLILRAPEVVALYYHIKLNLHIEALNLYYDTGKINELFDFLFTLHPLFQFILFYHFNKNFRDSFQDLVKNMKKEKEIN